MIVSAVVIISFVKYGLLRGIDNLAGALRWSPKLRGQITGYATSVPEFVCLVSAGLAGVWEAGLWNIASSNIINFVLLFSAMALYKQFRDLLNRRFVDEIGFATLAIATPIVLMQFGLDTQWYLIPILLAFFLVYQIVDRAANRPISSEIDDEVESVGSIPMGLILVTTALTSIIVAGLFLGSSTAKVVEQMGVHPAIAGWILGFVTSIPEMVTFFAIYAAAKRSGTIDLNSDTQEALDNLTGSNMANVGIVYPIGLLAFLIGSALF